MFKPLDQQIRHRNGSIGNQAVANNIAKEYPKSGCKSLGLVRLRQ